MRKKTVGALAGAAAAAVALGSGGTFALWSDSTSVDAGTIQAGNLDVAAYGQFQWYDLTENDSPGFFGAIWDFFIPRHDLGHSIANMNGSYRVVPGDVVAGYQDVTVDLHGDNLRAILTVGPGPGVPGSEFTGLDVEYGIYNYTTGAYVATGLGFGDETELYFQADGAGQANGQDDPGWEVLPRNSDLAVVIVAEFDPNTSGQTSTNAATALTNLQISLEQSRSALPIFHELP